MVRNCQKIAKLYRESIIASLSLYWKVYGGFSALIKSAYLHLSCLITLVLWPLWHPVNISRKVYWYDLIISIIPNILGFTLGGYAIFLAFGDKTFLKALAKYENNSQNEITPFLKANGAFIHFIVVQCFCLLFALIGNAWNAKAGVAAFLGVLLLVYSLTTALAAALALLNLSNWYNVFLNKEV